MNLLAPTIEPGCRCGLLRRELPRPIRNARSSTYRTFMVGNCHKNRFLTFCILISEIETLLTLSVKALLGVSQHSINRLVFFTKCAARAQSAAPKVDRVIATLP